MVSSIKSEKKRIIFIGRKTVGKSALIKSFLGQECCSTEEPATSTTNVTEQSMELPPYGSVFLVDTQHINSKNEPGKNQLEKAMSELSTDNFVVVVLDACEKLVPEEKSIFQYLKNHSIPFLAAVNKIEHGINSDLINALRALNIIHFEISCKENVGIDAVKARITRLLLA